jgi:hypothetical protein
MPRLGNQILVVNKYNITHADLDTPDSLTVAVHVHIYHIYTHISIYINDYYAYQ